MGFKAAVIVVFTLGVPAPPERPGEVKNVKESLQGEWVLIKADFGNKPPPPDAKVGATRIVFQGDKLTILPLQPQGRQEEASLSVDQSKMPCTIDIRPKVGPGDTIVVKGILQLKDGMLQLTFSGPGMERPTEFNPPPASATTAMVFQRATKK